MIGSACGRILKLEAGSSPLAVRRVADGRSTFVRDGDQAVLVRLPRRPSDPVHLGVGGRADVAAARTTARLADSTGSVTAGLTVAEDPLGLRFGLEVTAPSPIWMVEWTLRGLELDSVVVPALGGQELGAAMPAGAAVAFKYPFWWNAQFVIGRAPGGGGLMLHVRETDTRFKVLRVARSADGRFDWTLGIEAKGPLDSHTLRGEWLLSPFDGSWETAADAYREWMEGAFGPRRWDEAGRAPSWLGEIDLVAEMWGMHRSTGRPGHTFADMAKRLRELARSFPADRTLVYLPGFAEGGIDSNIPAYRPSPELGGDEGFAALVGEAHDLGCRVMIHTNVLGMTYDHPLFDAFREHQVVDVFGRPQGWGLDIDGDWLAEPFFAYINPAADAWGRLMEDTIGDLVHRFRLDAVFLDQTLLAFNMSRGGDFVAGMRRHIERLSAAMPGVVFGGEGVNEHVLPALPLIQIHGIDSIAEVHAMDGQVPWRTVHPVSMRVFSPYARFVAHLLTKPPADPAFAAQDRAYSRLGVVPAVVYRHAIEPTASPEIEAVFAQASALRRSAGR
jgi:hypothetical protein